MVKDDSGQKEFIIVRTFDAPRELVWKALSEVERLNQWWGPKGFVMKSSTLDFRPGGTFHYVMTSPDGTTMWARFAYREIVPLEKIVFVNSFSDEKGGITRHPIMGGMTWPLEMLNTLTLEERAGKTTVTLRSEPLNATEEEVRTFEAGHESMRQGFTGTWEQLEEYLRSHAV